MISIGLYVKIKKKKGYVIKKVIIFSILSIFAVAQTDWNLPVIMAANKIGGLNIGKKTEVTIALYAKNPSTICSLKIKNYSNPYKKDITKDKFKPITLEPGRYYRADLPHILKGKYEFEYTWFKDGKFLDSYLKTVRIFEYHNIKHTLHKRLNLTFWIKVPKECK